MPVLLAGHGGWDVVHSATPWVKVPRGTTISFYTENAKSLDSMRVPEIAALAMNDFLGESNGTYAQYQTCPNYTLYPDTLYAAGVAAAWGCLNFPAATPLCTGVRTDGTACIDSGDPFHTCDGIFADARVVGQEVIWLACRALMLQNAGGEQLAGVNATQDDLGDGGGTEGRDFAKEAWGYFNSASADDFWTYFEGQDDEHQQMILAWDQVAEVFARDQRAVPQWVSGALPAGAGWVAP